MLEVNDTRTYEQKIEFSNQVTIINLIHQPFQEKNMFWRFDRLKHTDLWKVSQGKKFDNIEIVDDLLTDTVIKNIFTYSFGGTKLVEERNLRSGVINTDDVINIVNYVDAFTKEQYEKTKMVWYHICLDYVVSIRV